MKQRLWRRRNFSGCDYKISEEWYKNKLKAFEWRVVGGFESEERKVMDWFYSNQ